MGKVLTLILSLTLAIGAQAASLNLNEISEIYVNDAAKNLLIVRTNSGKLMRLKVTPARREAIVQAISGTQAEEIAEVNSTLSSNTSDEDLDLLESTEKSEQTIVSEAATSRPATAATTSTTVEKVEEEKSPWSVGLLTVSGWSANDLANLKGTISNYIQVGFGYKLSENWKFSVIPNFSVNYSLDAGNAKNGIGNLPLELNRGTIAEVAGFKISTKGRFYLPTGESFRKTGTNGEARLYLNASRQLSSRISLGLGSQLKYYLQSDRSIAKFDEFGRLETTPKANTSVAGILGAELGLSITEKLTLSQSAGIFHALKYDDPELGLEDPGATTVFSQGLSLGISYLNPFYFSVGVEQSHNIEKSFAFYNPDETSYSLVMAVPLK